MPVYCGLLYKTCVTIVDLKGSIIKTPNETLKKNPSYLSNWDQLYSLNFIQDIIYKEVALTMKKFILPKLFFDLVFCFL